MVRRSCRPLFLAAVVLASVCEAFAQAPVVRILDRVEPVCTVRSQRDAAVVVEVVDDQAEPMEGVTVSVTRRRGEARTAPVLTDRTGRARFALTGAGDVRVEAGHVGFATSRADRLRVRPGCLTAVMLPMQVAAPKEIITAHPGGL